MTTPTGQISLSDVNVELTKSATALITKNDTDVRTLAGKTTPQSLITMDDLRGKTWDTSRPTVTITRSGTGTVIAGQTITITFTISETVTGFTSGDVSVTNGSISNFSGSGASYTATFTPSATTTGTAIINVPENSFVDLNNNQNLSGTLSFQIDTVVPTISISRSGSGTLGTNQTATITFTTSETSNNFISGDVSVTNGSISSFSGSGTNYTATFTPNANTTGTAIISVAAGAFTDTAGNNNIANSLSISIDTQSPSITITSSTSILIANQTATITFTTSESTSNFTSGDVSVTNGTLSNFSGSGTSYTATFTPNSEFSGTGTISVAAGAFTDSTGNSNTAGSVNISIETGGGGGVTIANPPAYNNTGYTSTDYSYGYAQVTLTYFANGTYQIYDNGNEGGFVIVSGNWATPTTAGIGSSYWVRFTRTSQNVGQYGYAVPTSGWIQIDGSSSQTYVSMSSPDGLLRTAVGTYTVELSSNSSGTNIVSSGSITLYAQSRTENFN